MAQEDNAFIKYGTKAREEHITYTESFVPGFVAFECDTDVYLGIWGKTLHKGTYFLLADDVKRDDGTQGALIYMVTFDAEQIAEQAEQAGYEETVRDDGTVVRSIKNETNLNLTMEPLEIERGHYLSFLEYIAWLAMTVAESDEIRDAIFHSAYKVDVKEPQDEELPRQDIEKPRKRKDPKTKVSRLIGIPENNAYLYQDLGVPLKVGESKDGKEVTQMVAIQYMGADGILAEGREQLTQLDRQVHYAIISHYAAGNRVVSLVQICELVYGHNKPSPEQRRDVEECIDRQMWTRITIDMTDEANKYNLKRPDLLTDYKLMGQMLAIRKITARAANGKTIVAYQLMGEPILYTHAQVTGQIITYPVKLLQAPENMKNTDKTMAIRQTLIEEIDRAKKGNRSKFMKYDTIYELSGQVPNSRTERSRQNTAVKGYLDLFIDNGLITSWEERKEGRKTTGFEVFFPEKKKSKSKR